MGDRLSGRVGQFKRWISLLFGQFKRLLAMAGSSRHRHDPKFWPGKMASPLAVVLFLSDRVEQLLECWFQVSFVVNQQYVLAEETGM